MSALVLANFPIAALIFAAMVGIPLWLTFKRPDRAPRFSAATSGAKTGAAYRAADITTARKHVAAHTPVPGRVHATAQRTARRHQTAAQRDGARA
ncbi:MAG TPA: hypothetical protein VIP48_14725 [Streptosporangiaceae bacterium]